MITHGNQRENLILLLVPKGKAHHSLLERSDITGDNMNFLESILSSLLLTTVSISYWRK